MFPIQIENVLFFVIVFLRIGAILFALPFFGDSNIPIRIRIVTTAALTIGISAMIPFSWAQPQWDLGLIFFMILKEIFVGLTIGYVARLMFEGIIMAANLVGYQMGFGTANLFIAGADFQLNAFTAFHRVIVLLIFLSLQFHHVYILAMVQTFKVIPAGLVNIQSDLGVYLISLTATIFLIGLKLSAPILISLLFTMAALGLVARTVPQMNVFTLSFPISFFIGLGVYITTLPFLHDWLSEFFSESSTNILEIINALSP